MNEIRSTEWNVLTLKRTGGYPTLVYKYENNLCGYLLAKPSGELVWNKPDGSEVTLAR